MKYLSLPAVKEEKMARGAEYGTWSTIVVALDVIIKHYKPCPSAGLFLKGQISLLERLDFSLRIIFKFCKYPGLRKSLVCDLSRHQAALDIHI